LSVFVGPQAILGKAREQVKATNQDERIVRDYGHLLMGDDKAEAITAKADGPEVTSVAILDALASPHPKTR
jgi:hypothetical protein